MSQTGRVIVCPYNVGSYAVETYASVLAAIYPVAAALSGELPQIEVGSGRFMPKGSTEA
jgi:hypothetical protein